MRRNRTGNKLIGSKKANTGEKSMKIKDTMPNLHGKLGVIHAISSTSGQIQRGAEPEIQVTKELTETQWTECGLRKKLSDVA